MTVLVGVVDAVSILSLGRVFVANTTGNVVFVGFALAGAPGFSISASLVAVGGFSLGTIRADSPIWTTLNTKPSTWRRPRSPTRGAGALVVTTSASKM